MFAGHNTNVLRTATMEVTGSGGRRIRAPLSLTSSYGRLFGELKVMPLRWRVKRLVSRLAQEQWVEVKAQRSVAVIQEYIQESTQAISYATEPLDILKVELSFWEYEFDGTDAKLTRKLLVRESASSRSSSHAAL